MDIVPLCCKPSKYPFLPTYLLTYLLSARITACDCHVRCRLGEGPKATSVSWKEIQLDGGR